MGIENSREELEESLTLRACEKEGPGEKQVGPWGSRGPCVTYASSQYQLRNVAGTTKLHCNWDKKLCQANNLRRSYWMCDEIPSQLATKIRGNIDECNISKPDLWHTCCICDENSWQIATKVKKFFFTWNTILPYYIVIWYTILYAILQCNMALPYYIVIWHYHITL